jgi:hypothetical protein
MGDLHQYVVEEDPVRQPKLPQNGRKVINLDDDDRYVRFPSFKFRKGS